MKGSGGRKESKHKRRKTVANESNGGREEGGRAVTHGKRREREKRRVSDT